MTMIPSIPLACIACCMLLGSVIVVIAIHEVRNIAKAIKGAIINIFKKDI